MKLEQFKTEVVKALPEALKKYITGEYGAGVVEEIGKHTDLKFKFEGSVEFNSDFEYLDGINFEELFEVTKEVEGECIESVEEFIKSGIQLEFDEYGDFIMAGNNTGDMEMLPPDEDESIEVLRSLTK